MIDQITVLLVDDDLTHRQKMAELIETAGQLVFDWQVSSPSAALEFITKIDSDSAPDLILTDYTGAGVTGATLAKESKLPTIVVTRDYSDAITRLCKLCGVVSAFKKWDDEDAIIAAIQNFAAERAIEELAPAA